MTKCTWFVVAFIAFLPAVSSGQAPCIGDGSTSVIAEDPTTGCAVVSGVVGTGADVRAKLVNWAFYERFKVQATLSGDVGDITNPDTAVLNMPCQMIDVDQTSPSQLHFIAKYKPGAHTVTATFTRCDQYPRTWIATWTLIVTAPPPPPSPCVPELVDPLEAKLLSGARVTSDLSRLETAVGAASGVAADGVTQLVLRIRAGDSASVNLNVADDSNGTSTAIDEIGGVTAIGQAGSGVRSLGVVAHAGMGSNAYAYALYHAPLNFVRASVSADNQAWDRTVKVNVTCVDSAGTAKTATGITVARPPVLLVHGLWSSAAEAWTAFVPRKPAQNALWSKMPVNASLAVDYDQPVEGTITATDPSYDASIVSNITRNALGFEYNAPFVLKQIRKLLDGFRSSRGVAATQADIVAHSMGGDILRAMLLSSLSNSFLDNASFGKGPVHKLITIGTPHRGTPLATQILDPINSCVANQLAHKGDISLRSLTLSGTGTISGAVADLQTGIFTNIPYPIAYVAGAAIQNVNLASLDCNGTCNANLLRVLCGTLAQNPLAKVLTSQDWPSVFGGAANDAIVPTSSQLNDTTDLLRVFPFVIHTPAIASLNFTGPGELQTASGIPDVVVDLLNERADGHDFQH